MAVQSATVADLDRRGAQIDDAVDELTRRGRVTGAMNLASSNERSGTPSRLKAAQNPDAAIRHADARGFRGSVPLGRGGRRATRV
jgi:hypothetical protein